VKLPLNTASDFFDLFLCDEAQHSLSSFHQSVMRDTNLSLSRWARDDANETAGNSDESLFRIIHFEHKSKVSIAQVTRNQTYRCYGKYACVKNVTYIKGVPSGMFFPCASDAEVKSKLIFSFSSSWHSRNFLCWGHVDYRKMWRLLHYSQRKISCYIFKVHLSEVNYWKQNKVTIGSMNSFLCVQCSWCVLLKYLFTQTPRRSETLEWYDRYTSFLREATQVKAKSETSDEIQLPHVLPDNSYNTTLKPKTQLLLSLSLFIVAFLVYSLKRRIMELENILAEIESRIMSLENDCLLGQ
jgi:hypothetical protein